MQLTRKEAQDFYYEHEEKFFYERLVSFISSGPISVHILHRKDAIKLWRGLLGNTKVYLTQIQNPDSIRGRFGLTDTRNVAHGSDSEGSARTEISHFFPSFDYDRADFSNSIDIHEFIMKDFTSQPALMKMLPKLKFTVVN